MATKIRLARAGAKKQPFYRIVVTDSRSSRDGKFIEKLGFFDPLLPKDNEKRLNMNIERIKYWLGVGAEPSERVDGLLVAAKIKERSPHNQRVLNNRIKISTEAKKKKLAEEAAAKKAAEEQAAAAAAEGAAA